MEKAEGSYHTSLHTVHIPCSKNQLLEIAVSIVGEKFYKSSFYTYHAEVKVKCAQDTEGEEKGPGLAL